MDISQFLLARDPVFGPIEWVFFIAQIVLAAVGVYLALVRNDTHPIRGPLLRQLGYALLAVGVVGTLLGALKLGAVDPFTSRLWLFINGLFELVVGIIAVSYRVRAYPAALAEYERQNQRRPAVTGQRVTPSNRGSAPQATASRPPRAPRPVEVSQTHSVSGQSATRRARRRRKK
jgi:hypothetical protein